MRPPSVNASASGLLRLPEDLVDLADEVEKLLSVVRVVRLLGGAGGLGGVPEELVQVRVRLEVVGLEVVGPQNPQVVLDEVGALFLDEYRAILEDRVVRPVVLLLASLHRL